MSEVLASFLIVSTFLIPGVIYMAFFLFLRSKFGLSKAFFITAWFFMGITWLPPFRNPLAGSLLFSLPLILTFGCGVYVLIKSWREWRTVLGVLFTFLLLFLYQGRVT